MGGPPPSSNNPHMNIRQGSDGLGLHDVGVGGAWR